MPTGYHEDVLEDLHPKDLQDTFSDVFAQLNRALTTVQPPTQPREAPLTSTQPDGFGRYRGSVCQRTQHGCLYEAVV